jgi:hypothetical protein
MRGATRLAPGWGPFAGQLAYCAGDLVRRKATPPQECFQPATGHPWLEILQAGPTLPGHRIQKASLGRFLLGQDLADGGGRHPGRDASPSQLRLESRRSPRTKPYAVTHEGERELVVIEVARSFTLGNRRGDHLRLIPLAFEVSFQLGAAPGTHGKEAEGAAQGLVTGGSLNEPCGFGLAELEADAEVESPGGERGQAELPLIVETHLEPARAGGA